MASQSEKTHTPHWRDSETETQPSRPVPRYRPAPNGPPAPGYPQPGPADYEPWYPPPQSQTGYVRRNQYRYPDGQTPRHPAPRSRRRFSCGCFPLLVIPVCLLLFIATYIIAPGRTNLLLLGIDYAEPGSYASRTDTIIMTTFTLQKPMVSLLSIPRDLWVNIPGVGENRINTAHFYAESQQAGTGPAAVEKTIKTNFDVEMDYFLRVRFEGFQDMVDAIGGVDMVLDQPTAGYPAGKVHLTGHKALAFVRDRASSDDFSRMSNGQLMLRALFMNMINPAKWRYLPSAAQVFIKNIDTNLPVWMIPRLVLMLILSGPNNIDFHVLPREMVTPFTTNQGASVLLPNWDLIRPLIKQIFF